MGKITVTITPSGAGQHSKYVTVFTNDKMLGEFRLTVKFEPFRPKGYRVGSFVLDPNSDIEATIAPDQIYEAQIGVYYTSDRSVEIKKTVADNANFNVNLETTTPGREFKLRVKSSDKLSAGTHKLLVKLMTDDPNQETLEVSFLVKAGNATPEPVKSAAPAKTVSKKTIPKSKSRRYILRFSMRDLPHDRQTANPNAHR